MIIINIDSTARRIDLFMDAWGKKSNERHFFLKKIKQG